MFKSVRLKLPHDRRDVRFFIEQDLTEENAGEVLRQIQESKRFNIQYLKDMSPMAGSRAKPQAQSQSMIPNHGIQEEITHENVSKSRERATDRLPME